MRSSEVGQRGWGSWSFFSHKCGREADVRKRVKPTTQLINFRQASTHPAPVCFQYCSNSDSGDMVFAFQGSPGSSGLPGLPGPPGLPGLKGDRVSFLVLQKAPYLEGIPTMLRNQSCFWFCFQKVMNLKLLRYLTLLKVEIKKPKKKPKKQPSNNLSGGEKNGGK